MKEMNKAKHITQLKDDLEKRLKGAYKTMDKIMNSNPGYKTRMDEYEISKDMASTIGNILGIKINEKYSKFYNKHKDFLSHK